MKIARLAGLVLFAVAAMSLAAVSSASAKEPLFSPASGQLVIGISELSILFADNGVDIVHCEKDVFHGFVDSSLLIGEAFVHYLECESSGNGGVTFCPVNSLGAAEGLILTNELHGVLGLILPSRETGILFLPQQKGKSFVELAANSCTPETAVSGNVAGLITPTGKLQTTGKVIFEKEPGPGFSEEILDIDLTHGLGLVKPQLTAFTSNATLSQLENVTFAVATEVT
jgi:hypothetical protein